MLKQVYYPRHIIQNGITKNHKGTEDVWNVGAFDTETVNGKPNTLQFSFNGKDAIVHHVTPKNIFEVFVQEVALWASRKGTNVLFAHNLKFDMQSILWRPDYREFFGKERRDFVVPIIRKDGKSPLSIVDSDAGMKNDDIFAAYIHCFTDKTWFARMKLSDRIRVSLVDTNAFFKMSLAEAASMVGSPVPKLERPKLLGAKDLTGNKQFEEYIRNDAKAQWYVGHAVRDLHEEHDIRMSVSLPQMAARILRHRFFREKDRIDFPPHYLVRPLELSYHGGKNQMLRKPDGSWAAGYYKNVWEVDINSAYTSAMASLPSFIRGEWKQVDQFVPGSHGVYCISGEVNCKYGCVFTHDFLRIEGPFEYIWITSYELESALATGCVMLRKCMGHVWLSKARYSPLREFALHFWDEKARWTAIEGKRGFHTLMSKLFPNSTYGKLISTIFDPDASEISIDEDLNIVSEKLYRACGLYNPAIATLITGYVRGKLLHTHEHIWDSIHSSTDSIKTLIDPTKHPDIGKNLGQWSVEIKGPCCLLRPKLYIHESDTDVVKDKVTGIEKKKMKYALHGFRGKVEELMEAADYEHDGRDSTVLKGRDYDYMALQVWTARQSLIRSRKTVVPLNFERVPLSLRSVLGVGPRIAKMAVPAPLPA